MEEKDEKKRTVRLERKDAQRLGRRDEMEAEMGWWTRERERNGAKMESQRWKVKTS